MSEDACMVCNTKAFEIEIQEDSEEVSELKKGNKYCLDCYGPLQEQYKLTLELFLLFVKEVLSLHNILKSLVAPKVRPAIPASTQPVSPTR